MIRLLRLLRDHPDAVEADLSTYHRIELVDLWRGRLTFRRLAVLLRFLPPDSATETALRGGPAWTIAHDIADLHRQEALIVGRVSSEHVHPHPANPAAAPREVSPDLAKNLERVKALQAERDARMG